MNADDRQDKRGLLTGSDRFVRVHPNKDLRSSAYKVSKKLGEQQT
jgi:hypothetical protein